MKFNPADRFALGPATGTVKEVFPGTIFRGGTYTITFDGHLNASGNGNRSNIMDVEWFDSVAEKIETPKPALRAVDVLPTLKVGQKITIRTDRGEPLWGEDKAVVKFLALEPREGKEPIVWVVTGGSYTSADFSFIAKSDTIEVIED